MAIATVEYHKMLSNLRFLQNFIKENGHTKAQYIVAKEGINDILTKCN